MKQCKTCKHQEREYGYCVNKGCSIDDHLLWEPVEMEVEKEPDYSFSKEIQNALKAGKSVWIKENDSDWFQFTEADKEEYWISVVWRFHWALEKPKIKVKKWQWIFKKQGLTFNITDLKYSEKEAEKENLKEGSYKLVEPYLPSEVEVEQ